MVLAIDILKIVSVQSKTKRIIPLFPKHTIQSGVCIKLICCGRFVRIFLGCRIIGISDTKKEFSLWIDYIAIPSLSNKRILIGFDICFRVEAVIDTAFSIIIIVRGIIISADRVEIQFMATENFIEI